MIYSTILKLHPRSPSSRFTYSPAAPQLCVVLCNICMQHLFNNCASFVQYLSISFNSFLVFVEHFQGGATQICVFLCIFEFAHAPRCVFEVFGNDGLQARLFRGLLGLLAGPWQEDPVL